MSRGLSLSEAHRRKLDTLLCPYTDVSGLFCGDGGGASLAMPFTSNPRSEGMAPDPTNTDQVSETNHQAWTF